MPIVNPPVFPKLGKLKLGNLENLGKLVKLDWGNLGKLGKLGKLGMLENWKTWETWVPHFQAQPARDLLNELRDMYMLRSPYVRGDTHETAYRLGQESIVKLLIEISEGNNG